MILALILNPLARRRRAASEVAEEGVRTEEPRHLVVRQVLIVFSIAYYEQGY